MTPQERAGVQNKVPPPPLRASSGDASTRDASELLTGIIQDAREYVQSYGELVKHDIRVELRDLKVMVVVGSIAAYSVGAGVILLAMAAAYYLASATGWPIEGGFALVGAVVVLLGLAGVAIVIRKAKNMDPPVANEVVAEDARVVAHRITE